MITLETTVEVKGLDEELRKYAIEVGRVHMKDAVLAGAKVIAATYEEILAKAAKPKAGMGNPSFIHAKDAVLIKIGIFGNGMGAWAVIGPKVVDGKLQAPQQQFGEKGTEERSTKTRAYRGKMGAYRWLARAAQESAADARNAIVKRLIKLVN